MLEVSFVCPRCRVRGPTPRAVPLSRHDGVYVCSHPACNATYPALPFPALLRDPSSIAGPLALVPWHRLDPRSAVAWLEGLNPDSNASLAARRMATYAWAHFRDLLPPELTPSFVQGPPLPVSLARLADGPCESALVMGTGAGRLPLELASLGAQQVVALDLDPMFVAWASELAADGQACLPVPLGAVRWTHTSLSLPGPLAHAAPKIAWLCADALDPPLPYRSFDLVVLPNLLDNVADPLALLAQAGSLLVPGGRLVISTPFAWQRNVTPPDARLEALSLLDSSGRANTLDGPDTLIGILTGALRTPHGFRMSLAHHEVIPWHLRIHARQFNSFECHVFVLRHEPRASSRIASCG